MSRTMRTMRWLLPAVLLLCAPLSAAWAAGTPAGSVISNFATMDFKDANGNAFPQSLSNTVTTVVSQVAGVDVSPATSSQSVEAGSAVVFPATVSNIGNGADTLDLTYPALPAGWAGVLYADTNANGVLEAGEAIPGNVISSIALAADATQAVLLEVTAPGGAANGDAATVTVTATSQFNAGVSDSGAYTATVETAVIAITKVATPANPQPGDVVTYALNGINSGSGTAYDVVVTDALPTGVTFVPGSIRFGVGAGTSYGTATPQTDTNDADPADFGVTAGNTVTFAWGDSPAAQQGSIYFQVVVNDGVAAGTGISNVASALYSGTSGGASLPAINSTAGTVTVATKAIITLSSTALALTGDSGDSLKYAYSITNGGNASDKFNLTPSSTQGFTSITWHDANNDGIVGNDGDHILTDTNGDGKVDTDTMIPGAVINIITLVVVTPGTSDLSVDVTTMTVASLNEPAVTGTVTLTTTVNTPVVSMTKAVSPVGAQPPGTVLTYTLTITNTGHGVANSLVIADPAPTFTTYQPGTITVNGSSRTDAADGDNAALQSTTVVVDIATIGPGGSDSSSRNADAP